ncbi:hypothetical protein BDV12DRAFT_210217 [Aspergillus spectabilis]
MSENPSVVSIAHREGFAELSRWIALEHDNETYIYRRFRGLSARNLTYMQCEMLLLEKRLHELDEADADSDEDINVKDEARTWETFINRYESGTNQKARLRMELVTQLRCKIKEYQEALLLQAEVTKLQRPSKRALDCFRPWLLKPHAKLGGLMSLNKPPETDFLSVLLRNHWPAREELSRDGLYRIGRYNEASITTAGAIINILISLLLLIGSIVGLYFAESDALKLALVAAFTGAFAISVGFMTNARRAEVFGATAAYAAVLVVFVSGDISSTSRT